MPIGIIPQYMPEFEFRKAYLRMFPEAIIAAALQEFKDSDLPPGYGEWC